MFTIDLGSRENGLGRRSMVAKPSATPSNGGGSKSSSSDVIDLVSDCDDDNDDEVVEVASASGSKRNLVYARQSIRDINDNTGCSDSGEKRAEKQTSMFERRSYHSERYGPMSSDLQIPGDSFGRITISRRDVPTHTWAERRSSAVSPVTATPARHFDQSSPISIGSAMTSTVSGIICNRSYNKTPALMGTSNAPRLTLDSPPVIATVCLEETERHRRVPDDGLTHVWRNRNDNIRRASVVSNTNRAFTPRSNLLRRSFHKQATPPLIGPTIDLVQDSGPTASSSTSRGSSIRSSNVRVATKEVDLVPRRLTVPDDTQQSPKVKSTQEWMDFSEIEEISLLDEPLQNTVVPTASADVLLVEEEINATEPPPVIVNVSPQSEASLKLVSSAKSVAGRENEADDQGSSMGNSYGDVSSSGCLKNHSNRYSVGRRQGVTIGGGGRQPLNEFDLMLLKINQTIPPMSHKDRIDQWRVTAEDLRLSIPTKAAIETCSTCTKRPHDDTVHISSEDDSDNLDDTEEPCTSTGQRANKKRRTIEGDHGKQERSEATLLPDGTPPEGDARGLDFRKSQINPEIDKPACPCSMIQARRNYHKHPTRYRRCNGRHGAERANHKENVSGRRRSCGCPPEERPSCSPSLAGGDAQGSPYANLLIRDEERDRFLSYLEIIPFFRTDENLFDERRRAATKRRSDGDSRIDPNTSAINEIAPSEALGNSSSRMNRPMAKNRSKTCVKRKKAIKNKTNPSVIASSALRGVRRLVLHSSLRNGKVIRYRNNILNTRAVAKLKPKQGKLHSLIEKSSEAGKTAQSAPEKPEKNGTARRGSTVSGCRKESPLLPIVSDSTALVTSGKSNGISKDLEHLLKKEKSHRMIRRSHSTTASIFLELTSPVPSSSASVGRKSSKGRCSVDSAVSSSTSAEMRHDETKRSQECQTISTMPPLADVTIERKQLNLSPPPVVNEGKRLRNPLARTDGEVLHVFLIDEQLIVVQRDLVSFWRYSQLSVLLGVKQDWQRIAQIQRWNRDNEVDTHNSNRIVFSQNVPVYLEPRARNLNDDKSRACPLASIYVNAYFLDTLSTVSSVTAKGVDIVDTGTKADCTTGGEDGNGANDELLRMKSYQLDTVKSALEDIRLVPLPDTRDFIVCWYEHVSDMESSTGLAKYSPTPDLDTLGCIREFSAVGQRLRSLKCVNDRKLLGLGESTVHIWCFESGYLLRTVDLKIDIGLIMCSFLHIKADENTLIMLQLQESPQSASNNRKLVKVIAVNLYKPTWYTAHSYEIALTSMSITSESPIWCMDESNATHRHCVTFDSGELLLVSLADPTTCWTNHQRLKKDLLLRANTGTANIWLRSNSSSDRYRPRERILNGCHWNGGRDLVFLSEQCLTTKTIDEYMLERVKDR